VHSRGDSAWRSPALEAVLESVPDGLVILDRRGRVRLANAAARRMLGARFEEVSLEEWPACCALFQADQQTLWLPEDLPMQAALEGRSTPAVEAFVRRPDLPEGLWISISAAPLADGSGAVVRLRDLGPEKRLQQELAARAARAEEDLRKFFRGIEQSPAIVLLTDAAGNIEYANPKFTELTGYRLEEVRGRNPRFLKSGHTPEEEYRRLWDTILEGREWRGEFLNRKKNGELYWESASISPVTAADGRITHFIAVKEDITERKRFEAALQHANAMLRAVIETSPLAICTLDLAGRITSWNAAAERIFGWSAEEVLEGPTPMVPEELQEEFRRGLEAAWRGETVSGLLKSARRKDGSPLEVLLWSAALRDAAGAVCGLVVLLDDVTQRRWMEEQLRQAQKMEAVGRLAGGVAHDFNNLLTIISGYGELLLSQVEDRLREDVKAILEGAQRASTLTRQLLALSRRQVGQPRVLDLNAIISGMEKLLRRALGEDVTLETTLHPSLWPVKADPAQLEQVLLNLAVNARDAMPRGGRFFIATANCRQTEAAALHLPRGEYVRLLVRDTGEGMDPEACRRIFEPFFSTKPREKGTGLGLAIVYGIVKQAGGEIFVDSRPGEGTAFAVYLPRSTGAPTAAPERPQAAPSAAHRETILLVEDEEGVRRLVREMLARHGYTVLEAADGQEALRVFEREGERIHLLLTDVVMPHMSGRELALRLTARRPELKVAYMSGYTGDVIADYGVLEPGVILIQKPFTARLLLRRLREALGAGTPRR